MQQLRRNFLTDNQRRTNFEPRRNGPNISTFQGSNQKNIPTLGNSGIQVSTSNSSGSNAESSNTRKPTRDIECFRCHGRGHYAYDCPNKRVMIMIDQGYESQSDSEATGIYDDMPPLEEDEEYTEDLDPVEGNVFVTMRSLSINTVHDKKVQRNNIFHTKCQINKKVCLMIIDSGSCTNVVSTLLIESLDY